MTEYKITIPKRQHPSLNKWTKWHWAIKSKEKKSWEHEIYHLCYEYGKPLLKNALIEITYYFKDARSRDKDNYTPKFILDGLVKANMIEDDNDSDIYVNWKIKKDKENPRTEIKIKEA